MRIEWFGRAVDVELVVEEDGQVFLLVDGALEVPAPGGYDLRAGRQSGTELAVELSRRDSGAERVRTVYLDLEAMTWRDKCHVEQYRRAVRYRRLYS